MSPAYRLSLYANGFLLGFVLMGFEMLGSRYLNPYFGSGIFTWAALISTALFALMVGYFAGGLVVDRWPREALLGRLILIAAVGLALVPLLADPITALVIAAAGDGPLGVMLAAVLLMCAPLTLIACFSPFCVRLLLESLDRSGRQTGLVYGITTTGNIFGTIMTAFWLVPSYGTRAITYAFAACVALSGLSLLLGRLRGEAARR